jgi:hypothetical protein
MRCRGLSEAVVSGMVTQMPLIDKITFDIIKSTVRSKETSAFTGEW